MKKHIHFKFLLAILLVCFFASCEKEFFGEIDPYQKELFLIGELSTNSNGGNPTLVIDQTASSKEFNISSVNSYISNNRIYADFLNVRIEDALGNYVVETNEEIITEEFREEKWVNASEGFISSDYSSSLDIVLVLDMSSSLGADVSDIKTYANNFIDLLFSLNSNVRIGIVGFSSYINELPFTNNAATARSFVNGLQTNQDATRLYEAMDKGIDLIQGSMAEGRAMVTFTDGRNNAATSTFYENSDYVYNKLLPLNISSNTIGLTGKGGVDETALQKLAVNGLYSFPETTQDTENIFNKFANSVASVYSFYYNRPESVITTPIKLRFRIKTRLL